MKSDIAIKDDVYSVILDSPLHQMVTGELSKTKRPHRSKNEDIVISILANMTARRQEAYVMVNIYCKDDDVDGQAEEQTPRLRELCNAALELFQNVRGNAFRLSLAEDQGQRVFPIEGTDEHVITNKLLYQIIND